MLTLLSLHPHIFYIKYNSSTELFKSTISYICISIMSIIIENLWLFSIWLGFQSKTEKHIIQIADVHLNKKKTIHLELELTIIMRKARRTVTTEEELINTNLSIKTKSLILGPSSNLKNENSWSNRKTILKRWKL